MNESTTDYNRNQPKQFGKTAKCLLLKMEIVMDNLLFTRQKNKNQTMIATSWGNSDKNENHVYSATGNEYFLMLSSYLSYFHSALIRLQFWENIEEFRQLKLFKGSGVWVAWKHPHAMCTERGGGRWRRKRNKLNWGIVVRVTELWMQQDNKPWNNIQHAIKLVLYSCCVVLVNVPII